MLDLLCSYVQLLDLETELALITYGIRCTFYYRLDLVLYSDVAKSHGCPSTDDHEVTICIKFEAELERLHVTDLSLDAFTFLI